MTVPRRQRVSCAADSQAADVEKSPRGPDVEGADVEGVDVRAASRRMALRGSSRTVFQAGDRDGARGHAHADHPVQRRPLGGNSVPPRILLAPAFTAVLRQNRRRGPVRPVTGHQKAPPHGGTLPVEGSDGGRCGVRTRSGIALRFLFLASLMLGIVAMHQLPMSHGSPDDHRAPAGQQSSADHRAGAGHQSGHDRHDAPGATTGKHAKPLLEADHGADHSAMLHLCLAILTAGFLLLAHWWLGTRWPSAPMRLRATARRRIRLRSPLWSQPCVFRLQVLRL